MNYRILFALSLVAPLAAGCTNTLDEDAFLGDEDVVDGDDGKSDIVRTTSTYYEIKPGPRWAPPYGGGYYVRRVNAGSTRCHDGTYRRACYVATFGSDGLGLGPAALEKVTLALRTSAVPVVARGYIAAETFPEGTFGRFEPSEVYVPQGPYAPDGPFVRVEGTGERCLTFPCINILGEKLNSLLRPERLAEIKFDESGASADDIAAAQATIASGNQVIITGYRYSVDGPAGSAWARTATQFYVRVEDEVKTCHVGGCSSQLCSDRPGMISTCEFRAEYACYRDPDARCEVQDDGTCGWTQTEELLACLANPPPVE